MVCGCSVFRPITLAMCYGVVVACLTYDPVHVFWRRNNSEH